MAKSIKTEIYSKSSKLTDEEFFLSKTFQRHLETIIEGVCESYKTHLKIALKNGGDFVAYTNGKTITLNISHRWIKNASTREEKYYILVGIMLHECGHVLFTDFSLAVKCTNALIANKLFPVIPYSDELSEAFAENMGRLFVKTYQRLDNSIEDGHIEKRVIKKIPGYGECLMGVRKLQLTQKKTYEEILESEEEIDKISLLFEFVLYYAKYGIDLTIDSRVDELTEVFNDCKMLINNAVKNNSPIKRKIEINKVFDRLFTFIVEEIKKDIENEKGSSDDSSAGSDSEGDSEKTETPEEKEDKEADTPEEKEKDEKDEEADKTSETSKDTSSESSTSDGKFSEKIKEAAEKIEKRISSLKDFGEESSHDSSVALVEEEVEDTSEDEEGLSGSSIKDGPPDIDLTYLEKTVAEEIVSEELHGKIEKEMHSLAEKTRKERVDKCPSKEVYLNPDERAEEEFDRLHIELDRVAKRVVKNLDKAIKERQIGDVQRGLYVGKTLDSVHAYRKDKKIMESKILPEDVPDMEVTVLVDCSGSMSIGERMPKSRMCAYITWKFCDIMNIPCNVYGHTSSSYSSGQEPVLMQCVAHKKNIDADDGKRIFMLRAKANNRDGWAVQFAAEDLLKSTASNKLLFIISDGIPCASGYSYTAGKKDVQEVVMKYKKKGIKVITAGIDECAKDIKDVYLDSVPVKYAAKFLDFTDMEGLPKAFANIIKKELL